MISQLKIIFAIFFLPLLYARYSEIKRIRRKQERIKHRERIPVEKLYHEHYEELSLNKDKVIYYWKEIARILRVDPEKLRPTDRFDKELAPVSKDSVLDELEDLEEFLVDEIENNNYEIDLKEVKTIDDIIKVFCG